MKKFKRGVKFIDLVFRYLTCPACGRERLPRHSRRTRRIKCVRNDIIIEYGLHFCPDCNKIRSAPSYQIAAKNSHYSNRFKRLAILMRQRSGKTLQQMSDYFLKHYDLKIPPSTLHEFVWDAERVTERKREHG